MLFALKSYSQTNDYFKASFTEQTTEAEKFLMYLDTIDKYIYRDTEIVELASNECRKILEQPNIKVHDTLVFEFLITTIYDAFNKADPLKAYEIIIENESKADNPVLSNLQVSNFNYLKSFTYMSIGDLESAQSAYYAAIDNARLKKDTADLIRNYYSLGQLLNDEKDTIGALRCYKEIMAMGKLFDIRPSTYVLSCLELSEVYTLKENYNKAHECLKKAKEVIKDNDLEILNSDRLFNKSEIYLKQNKLDSALITYEKLEDARQGAKDDNNIANTKMLLAQIYSKQNRLRESLKIYSQLISESDSSNFDRLIEMNLSASELSNKLNDHKSAHKYLAAHTELRNMKEEDDKRQKTAYLKIKFDTEQKENENLELISKIEKSEIERKELQRSIAISILFLMALFGLLFQRMRYSKQLEKQVQKRTEKLKEANILLNQSNAELNEFNRILSHDLTEPLRSIIGFSELASKETIDGKKYKEYLKFVIDSGQQLDTLIKDVSLYRSINESDTNDIAHYNMAKLMGEIQNELTNKYTNKEISINCDKHVSLSGPSKVIESVFRIIIKNAAKYNKNQKVNIAVKHAMKNNVNQFLITDNGIGIEKQYHEQIFEMFKRLNHRGASAGSGLGLSIAKRLIELINGEISIVNSELEKGTTFQLLIPNIAP